MVKVISFDDHLLRLICHKDKLIGSGNKVIVSLGKESAKAQKSQVENNGIFRKKGLSNNRIFHP